MADLYSVIPGLQPSAQELLEAELLCKQILEAKFPDLDLREGTGLRDLVLRPGGLLFALSKKANDYYFTQRNISGIDDTSPVDIVDSILSNWFLTRNTGVRSIINSRLYFARRKNINLSGDVYFSTDNILKFFPVSSSSYIADALSFDSFNNEYYLDVDMIAEKEGTTYNLGSGSLLYFSTFDPYFLRAEINYLKTESINSETNLEFIARAKNAISTRNLINIPSIDSNLRQVFNYITRLVSIGMGDPEMIRDQIRAVFEDQVPRVITNLVSTGTLATATLANHGYNSGQIVSISNTVPSGYNGQYTITVINSSSFTYTLSTSLGVVTSPASVNSVNLPILIHDGGMVDVYCSDKLATSIVQVTTDEFGKTSLTGPIYDFSRSSLTGGEEEDTIPVLNTNSITTIVITGTTAVASTATPHNYLITDIITVAGASLASLNGPKTLTAVDSSSFSYTIPVTSLIPVTGTMTCSSPTRYATSNINLETKTITTISSAGTTVTVTLAHHGYSANRYITIKNCSVNSYNGVWLVNTIVSENQFQFRIPSSVTNSTSSGIIVSVFPRYDYGFSQRQTIEVDFGVSNANKTASFVIKYFQNVDSIQNYLEDANNRVLCADYLARGFNFYNLSVEVISYNGPAPDQILVSNLVLGYLNSLEVGEMFIMSDMVARLRLNGITNIQNPPLVTYKSYNRDLVTSPYLQGTITDILDPNDSTNVFMLEAVTTDSEELTINNIPITI